MAIKPIRGCYSTPVLPTVYDEALSYEEQVCKLTHKMNEIIDFANGELTEELRDYIDKRFNDMFINAAYNADTETITLYLDEK